MASRGRQRRSRYLSVRRDHTPREIQGIVFPLLWTMCAIYFTWTLFFFLKNSLHWSYKVETMCVIYLTWTRFFLFIFSYFLKIIPHWFFFFWKIVLRWSYFFFLGCLLNFISRLCKDEVCQVVQLPSHKLQLGCHLFCLNHRILNFLGLLPQTLLSLLQLLFSPIHFAPSFFYLYDTHTQFFLGNLSKGERCNNINPM